MSVSVTVRALHKNGQDVQFAGETLELNTVYFGMWDVGEEITGFLRQVVQRLWLLVVPVGSGCFGIDTNVVCVFGRVHLGAMFDWAVYGLAISASFRFRGLEPQGLAHICLSRVLSSHVRRTGGVLCRRSL